MGGGQSTSPQGTIVTHHIIAARNYRQENHTGKVFQLGKGKIQVLQPDMGDPDFVTEAWFKEYRNILPPGTIIVRNGVTFRIEERP